MNTTILAGFTTTFAFALLIAADTGAASQAGPSFTVLIILIWGHLAYHANRLGKDPRRDRHR